MKLAMLLCKRVAVVFSAALLAVSSSGCASLEEAAAESPAVSLTFMLPQTHFKDFLRQSIDEYESSQAGCVIDVQVIPDNQWVNMIKMKAFTNDPPDLVRIDKSVMLQIGPERFVEFAEDAPWLARAIPAELESKKIDGKIYGLPVASNSTIGLVCNMALFEKYGLKVPGSIEEMREICERFLAHELIPLYASDKDSWTTQIWFSAAAPQVVPDETWQALFSNQAQWSGTQGFEQVLNDMAQLRSSGCTNSDYMMATYESAVDVMAGGTAAMYVSGHFFINDVLAKKPDMRLRMAPMLYSDKITVIQSQGMFSVFKNSAHVKQAGDFLNWFSGAENMDAFTGGWGYTPLFADQKPKLAPWLEEINQNYLSCGKTVFHVDSQLMGVDFSDFWSLQQELVGGGISAASALRGWDEAYTLQMKNRKTPGF